MIMRCALLLAMLTLAACASPDGPGSLERTTVASGAAAPVGTAPRPASVTSQTLAAPGTQPSAFPQQGQSTTPGQFGQATAAPAAPAGTLQPGSVSTAQPTLQDFAQPPLQRPGSGQGQTIQDPNAPQTLQQTVQGSLQPQQVAPALTPAGPQWPRVSLAPITTAPEPNATQLFDAIDDAVFRRGLQLAFFGDETAQFVVRSQVSAIPADQVTSVIYVFDIFDARGTLRHRVSGARAIPRSGPDGWALVDQNTTQLIADDVAGRMMAWFLQNPS